LLTKADLNQDHTAVRERVEAIAPGATVLLTSSVTGAGLDQVRAELGYGVTGVLVGPSGVGKSTLINHLTGQDSMATAAVRRDGKGRHTTTHRQLIPIESGGMIIDTPGIRELQVWHGDEGLGQAFDDIAQLAAACRFNNCGHEQEAGVRRAGRAPGRVARQRTCCQLPQAPAGDPGDAAKGRSTPPTRGQDSVEVDYEGEPRADSVIGSQPPRNFSAAAPSEPA